MSESTCECDAMDGERGGLPESRRAPGLGIIRVVVSVKQKLLSVHTLCLIPHSPPTSPRSGSITACEADITQVTCRVDNVARF